MVRIAGIDREVSPLELMWAQADVNEKSNLAVNLLMRFYDAAGQEINLKVDTDDGMYVITVNKIDKQESSNE